MGESNYLVPPFQQQTRDSHIQHRIGKTVVPGDQYKYFVLRIQRGKQFTTLPLYCCCYAGVPLGLRPSGQADTAVWDAASCFPRPSIADAIASCPKSRSNTGVEQLNAPPARRRARAAN